MAFDFMGLFDSFGLFWQASKTNDLSNDDGTLSQYRQPKDLEAESRQREREETREDRRKQMQKKRQQHVNINSRNFQRK